MAILTKEQARALAISFHDLAQVIGNFRLRNSPTLSDAEIDRLDKLEDRVRNASSDMVALAIKLELDDLAGTLDRIGQATDRMQDAIKHLKKINSIIKLATAAVTLGAAVVSGNPGGILAALDGAFTAVTEAQEDDKKA